MSTTSDATFIETTWKSVAMKSNFALQTDCCGWIIHEKKCTVLVIIHIAEIAKRSIHLDEGFSSLYDYCRIKLQLSEGETYLRTQVAGVCSKHPELLAALFRGDISL